MIKYKLILFSALLLLAAGCGRIHEMNNEMDRSSALITQNALAVEKSTATVYANVQAVEASTSLIQQNSVLLKEMMDVLPTVSVKMGVLLLASFLLLPSLIVAFSMRRLEKRLSRNN
ncbi:MAG: hypothetical protein HYX48_00750 [Chlamydiales bacterium]|nr:hypothetical protein [Chlamydiales bacterium]